MELPPSANAAADGDAINVEDSLQSCEKVANITPSTANGLPNYRTMKDGRLRPSAVRDFPEGIIPVNRKKTFHDNLNVVIDEDGNKQAQGLSVSTKGKKQLSNMENSSPGLMKGAGNANKVIGKEAKSTKMQAERSVGSRNKQKVVKEKVSMAEKTQELPTKPAKSLVNKDNATGTVMEAEDASVETEKVDRESKIELLNEEKACEDATQLKDVKMNKSHIAKRKSGVRDLPETVKPAKPNLMAGKEGDGQEEAIEVLPDKSQEASSKMNLVAKERMDVNNTKVNVSGKKKLQHEGTASMERSKKPKLAHTPGKPRDEDLRSKTPVQSEVVTPKVAIAGRKSSAPLDSAKKVRRSAGKTAKPSTAMVSTRDVSNARKSVIEALRLYDAVRRKLVQDEERFGKQGRGSRADLQAASLLKDHGISQIEKGMGSLPGVEVGDVYLFRTELSFARVHGPIQAGIEYLTNKESPHNLPVAISIISNVGQDGEDGGEEFIYTGQGGRSVDNKQIADQKLERGNLALDGSRKFNVPVRVLRGIKDANSPTGKIYVYDGLYIVDDMFTAKGSGGFDEFKFRLRRMPDQPELGSETLKLASDLKSQSLASRKDVVVPDISRGKENQAICVENTVDDDRGPDPFEYSTKVIYPKSSDKVDSVSGCRCKGACSASSDCSCFTRNGDEMPYLNGGFLIRQKDFIFECSSKCSCSSNCRNRTTQNGLKFRLEVFKTVDRGWGVRSLETIPAGSFVCEYIGKLIVDEEAIGLLSNTQHVLFASRLADCPPRWGDVPASVFPNRPSSTVMPEAERPRVIIDASETGNVARFVNHSCSPNLIVQKVFMVHQDVPYLQFKLFTIDHIPPLKELTFDYGYPSDQELASEERSIECLCGSKVCRGKLYL